MKSVVSYTRKEIEACLTQAEEKFSSKQSTKELRKVLSELIENSAASPIEKVDDYFKCKICAEYVHSDDFRKHAGEHNPNAYSMESEGINDLFEDKE